MWKALILCVIALSSSVHSAEVDDRFVTGPLGVVWGANVEIVKAAFGDGLLWPVFENPLGVDLIYGVQGNGKLYWQDIPIQLVQFAFTKEGKVIGSFVSFDTRETDAVYQHCVDILGRNYSVKQGEFETETVYTWATSNATKFVLKISNRQPYSWVVIGAAVDTKRADPKNESQKKSA